MNDVVPGWYTTIYPVYFTASSILSILATVSLCSYVVIKILKIEKDKYQKSLNITNLIFCILSSVLLGYYLFELIIAWYSGYIHEQFSSYSRLIGPYWIFYLALMWIPLILTQLFWKKKNRININLALLVVFMFNLHMWVERIYIFIVTWLRN